MAISTGLKEKNFELFIEKLSTFAFERDETKEDVNVEENVMEKITKVFGDKLLNATYTISNDYGNAYDGSFLHILLRTLIPTALGINELLPENVRPQKETLIKVLLVHQLAKALIHVPNDNKWEIEKRNMLYKYAENKPAIKTGLYSLMLAMELGIKLTPEEAEAVTINDRSLEDSQSRWHSSVLSTVVRQANELTYTIINTL